MMRRSVSALSQSRKSLKSDANRDFFGIFEITSKDIAAVNPNLSKLSKQKRDSKFHLLQGHRKRFANEEVDQDLTFGRIRVDSQNVPKTHGQYEPTNEEPLTNTIEVAQAYLPQDTDQAQNIQQDSTESEKPPNIGNLPYKISEVRPVEDILNVFQMFSTSKPLNLTKYRNVPPLTFFFEYTNTGVQDQTESIDYGDEHKLQKIKRKREKPSSKPKERSTEIEHGSVGLKTMAKAISESKAFRNTNQERPCTEEKKEEGKKQELVSLEDRVSYISDVAEDLIEDLDDKFDKSLDKKYDVDSEKSKPTPALQYLKQIRNKQIEPSAVILKRQLQNKERPYASKPLIKLDSQGFRVYTHQVPDWNAFRYVDLLNHIKSSIIYHNYDILAFNKPYGISSQGEKNEDNLSMVKLAKDLAPSLRVDEIFPLHRIDKNTTGILLFATSKTRASEVQKLFVKGEIIKRYWCITSGVPKPKAAVIDIPIGTFSVASKTRCCPVPEGLSEKYQLAKRYREARRATTEYRVLEESKNVALVEVTPKTGVKHQIRCHLGLCLKTPVLGDHKYSHLSKIAPQQLSSSILRALQLRQQKARTLPMHLHSKTIVIPGVKANRDNLFIDAPLPQHFIDNMKNLDLPMP